MSLRPSSTTTSDDDDTLASSREEAGDLPPTSDSGQRAAADAGSLSSVADEEAARPLPRLLGRSSAPMPQQLQLVEEGRKPDTNRVLDDVVLAAPRSCSGSSSSLVEALPSIAPPGLRLTYSTTLEAAADLAATMGTTSSLSLLAVPEASGGAVGASRLRGDPGDVYCSEDSRASTPIPVLTPVSETNDPPTRTSRTVTPRMDKQFTAWRLPAVPGTMPVYIQQSFRVKIFSLLSVQFVVIFAVMQLAERLLPHTEAFAPRQHHLHLSGGDPFEGTRYLAFGGLGLLVITTLSATYIWHNDFPMNYLLLTVVSIIVGLFWGMASVLHESVVYNQVVAIMGLAMMVATPTTMWLTRIEIDPWQTIIATLLVGWFIASVVVLMLAPSQPGQPGAALVSMVAAFLLLGTFFFNAGRLLVRCSPDDFLRVVVTANATLLVVVSIPFMLLVSFIIKACNLQETSAEQPEPNTIVSEIHV